MTINVTISAFVKKVKGKVVHVHVTQKYRGSRGTAPLILDLGAR
jgi:hypothetical protein